jgi:hypothetical protein
VRAVVRAGFDEANPAVGVLTQPRGEYASRRAGAEHDDVVGQRDSARIFAFHSRLSAW